MKTFSFSTIMAATAAPVQTSNVQTAVDNYSRFGQGDIPGILSTFAENAVWIHAGNASLVPFAGTFNGVDGIARFFEAVAKSVRITVFQPSNFREEGNRVVNDIHIEGTVLSTGKNYSNDAMFTWTFDQNGKAMRWEASGDMSKLEAAFQK